ncbi:hypothetical protein PINS_up007655 [Pythium insidiosum]|nr:hypothetical protein PINS_up007655 [Pythium insidiosum]
MGNSGSSLVDCIHDGDITGLKEALTRLREDRDLERQQDLASPELEDAVHAALSMEVSTARQFQQLQIALELLLQTSPHVLRTADCNLCGWTALHRACVTGNLSFVPFLFERHAQHLCSARDAFGLTPIDLVPPELATTDAAAHKLALTPPATLPTAYERRLAALHLLRDAKRELQAAAIEPFLPPLPLSEAPMAGVELEGTDVDVVSRPRRASLSATEFYITLDGHHEHVPDSYGDHVHELERPLRLRYRLPRVEAVVHGYFQLIWRGVDDPRSEEPQYDHHVLLRDEMFLDVAADDLESNQHETRRLDDDAPVLRGCIPISVAHLPDESVCHVLFIASDKHMMKRQILLSTEGVRLLAVNQLGEVEMGGGGAVDPHDDTAQMHPRHARHGFVFHVAGEEFTHPSEELSGQVFESVEEFEAFVKALRHAKTSKSYAPEEQSSNQRDNDDDDDDDDDDDGNLKERGAAAPLSCDAA